MTREEFDNKWDSKDEWSRSVWVAMEVLKWTHDPSRRDSYWRDEKGHARSLPLFASYPDVAWQVVEKIRKTPPKGLNSPTFCIEGVKDGGWRAGWRHDSGDYYCSDDWSDYSAVAPTMPEAVCKVALLSILVPTR